MEIIIKGRAVVRRAFTRLFNELTSQEEHESEDDGMDMYEKFETLKVKFQELRKLDVEIFELMLNEDKSDDELDEESKSVDKYLMKFFKVKAIIEKNNSETSSENTQISDVKNIRKFKLPTLQLKSFNGNIKYWLPFWSQFQKIDEEDSIDPADKFQYLIQFTTPNSRARELVESYPATAENYPKAIQCLKERFGQKDMLVEVYIRGLLSLVMKNGNSRTTLSSLYDKLEAHLRALESLGVATGKFEAILFPHICRLDFVACFGPCDWLN